MARAWHASTSKWTSGAPHRRVMHRLLANRSIGNAGYRPPKRKRSSTDSCKIIDLRPGHPPPVFGRTRDSLRPKTLCPDLHVRCTDLLPVRNCRRKRAHGSLDGWIETEGWRFRKEICSTCYFLQVSRRFINLWVAGVIDESLETKLLIGSRFTNFFYFFF